MSLSKWELVSVRLNRLGISCTPKVKNKLYRKKRLKTFVEFNRNYYARILGNNSCYVDINSYIDDILNGNMEEKIADFILTHTQEDLLDDNIVGN